MPIQQDFTQKELNHKLTEAFTSHRKELDSLQEQISDLSNMWSEAYNKYLTAEADVHILLMLLSITKGREITRQDARAWSGEMHARMMKQIKEEEING